MRRDPRRKEDGVEEDSISIEGINEWMEETGGSCVTED